jgi:hypothetical protein
MGNREGGRKQKEKVSRGRFPWEHEKDAGSRMKESEEADCLGKKRRRQEAESTCQKSHIAMGTRERGRKQNDNVRRGRLPWEKENAIISNIISFQGSSNPQNSLVSVF